MYFRLANRFGEYKASNGKNYYYSKNITSETIKITERMTLLFLKNSLDIIVPFDDNDLPYDDGVNT